MMVCVESMPFEVKRSGITVNMSDEAHIFHPACKLSEIEDDRGVPVELGDRVIAIFRTEGDYYAIDDTCPHKGVPLCDGLVDQKSVTCTWHGWRFSLETGCGLDGNRSKVGRYPVRISGENVEVGIPRSNSTHGEQVRAGCNSE